MIVCTICGYEGLAHSTPTDCVPRLKEERDRLKGEVERLERGLDQVMAERDAFEEKLTELAAEAGCTREWSNLHDHGDCITNEWADKLERRDAQIRDMRSSFRLIRDLTLDMEYYGPGESPILAAKEVARRHAEPILASSERPFKHHENCDTLDPMIKGKPCNCAKYRGLYEA